MNLREVIKKYGRNSGINIDAVRRYAKQLFQALRLLKKLGIIHADLKPDNIIVSADNHNIQVCDFGSAFRENGPDVIPTPYLVSRFYRAPEIILGDLYGCAIDVWSAATCFYEFFTGSVMFHGCDNNAMLHEMQLIKGAFPVKILRRHRTNYEKLEKDHHFVQMPDWRFKLNKIDRVTKRIITSYIVVTTPKKDLGKVLMSSLSASGKKKLVLQLKDLLMKCLALDPDKRVTPSQALKHPFISSKTILR
jgi:serine/threonine-protein kinase PRP4